MLQSGKNGLKEIQMKHQGWNKKTKKKILKY